MTPEDALEGNSYKSKVIYEDLIPMSFRKPDGFYITGYGSMFLTQLEYPALRSLNKAIGISLPVWWGRN